MDTLVVAPSWIGDAVLSHPLLVRLKARDPAGRHRRPRARLGLGRSTAACRRCAARSPSRSATGSCRLGGRRRFARELAALRPRHRAAQQPQVGARALVRGHPGAHRLARRDALRPAERPARASTRRRCPSSWSASRRWRSPRASRSSARCPSPGSRSIRARRDATLAKFGLDAATRPCSPLAPGAEYGPAKRWPARHFAELARAHAARGFQRLALRLGQGRRHHAPRSRPSPACRWPTSPAGPRLDEAIDLLSLAARVVTNDSGLMHVAAALDRPMAAVFGSSSPGLHAAAVGARRA